jgi:entericidin B
MRKFITLLSCCGMAVLVLGCNTIHGIGKDLERGGEAIQKAAK